MNSLSPHQVIELVLRALDRAAYVSAEAIDLFDETDGDRYATVDFECGDGSGSVYVSATDGFLREIAAGLLDLNEDDIDVDTEGVEALMELASILGEEVIEAIGGGELRSSLSSAATMDPNQMPDGGELYAKFESNEGRLEVAVDMR